MVFLLYAVSHVLRTPPSPLLLDLEDGLDTQSDPGRHNYDDRPVLERAVHDIDMT